MIKSSSLTQAITVVMLRSSQTVHVPFNTPRADVSESSFGFHWQPLAKGFGSDHQLESHEIAGITRLSANCGMMAAHVVGPVVQALRELVHPTSCIW